MMAIEISRKPNIVENIMIGDNCSPREVKICIALFKKICDASAWS